MSEGFRSLSNFVISFGFLGLMGAFAESVVGFRALLWLNVAVFGLLAVLGVFAAFLLKKRKQKLDNRAVLENAADAGASALKPAEPTFAENATACAATPDGADEPAA